MAKLELTWRAGLDDIDDLAEKEIFYLRVDTATRKVQRVSGPGGDEEELELDKNIIDALLAANDPSETNEFLTKNDMPEIPASEPPLPSGVRAALEANSALSGSNPVAGLSDLSMIPMAEFSIFANVTKNDLGIRYFSYAPSPDPVGSFNMPLYELEGYANNQGYYVQTYCNSNAGTQTAWLTHTMEGASSRVFRRARLAEWVDREDLSLGWTQWTELTVGAGMPSDRYIEIPLSTTTQITDYHAPADGYIAIAGKGPTVPSSLTIRDNSNLNTVGTVVDLSGDSNYRISLSLPIRKGAHVWIVVGYLHDFDQYIIDYARFIYAEGAY